MDAKCCCGLKGGNTFFPCNICGAAQHQLHKVDLAEFELRSPDDLKECRGARTACAKTEQSLTSQFTSGDISKEALTDGKRAARVELKLQQDMLDSMSGLDVEPALDRLRATLRATETMWLQASMQSRGMEFSWPET